MLSFIFININSARLKTRFVMFPTIALGVGMLAPLWIGFEQAVGGLCMDCSRGWAYGEMWGGSVQAVDGSPLRMDAMLL